MKSIRNLAVIAFALMVIIACGRRTENPALISERLEPGEMPEGALVSNLDLTQSTVAWTGSKVLGQHNGTIGISSGELYLVENQIVGGRIVIDMTQIVVVDITDPGMNASLAGHLKSPDFFSVDSFPQAYFEMAQIAMIEGALEGEPNYTIRGNLTVKGITHGIEFPATVSIDQGVLRAQANFDLDRTQWNVKFGSGRFIEGLGDNLIHDNFNLNLDVVALL